MTRNKRVVIVGVGLRSPIGNTSAELIDSLRSGRSGITAMGDEWDKIKGLKTKVAGLCQIAAQGMQIPRKFRRTMGRVAVLAGLAAIDAVADSGLREDTISSSCCGVSFGSTSGGSHDLEDYIRKLGDGTNLKGLMASHYLKCMSHTCAANLAILFGCKGPLISTCTACTSGSQGVGFGYEAVRSGQAEIMITGGAEEMHFMHAAVFDLMMATSSKFNHTPQSTPMPFDALRDGLVVAEGAGCLVLEEYERACRRGADIYAEILGFGNTSSGTHLTNSDAKGIESCLRNALDDAGLSPDQIEYINAHATATEVGDMAEAQAIHMVFGENTPVSTQKGHMGHTLGASGALESIATVLMAREGFAAPTLNLKNPDPQLPRLDLIMNEPRELKFKVGMNNNFAFGGVNTSLIFKAP